MYLVPDLQTIFNLKLFTRVLDSVLYNFACSLLHRLAYLDQNACSKSVRLITWDLEQFCQLSEWFFIQLLPNLTKCTVLYIMMPVRYSARLFFQFFRDDHKSVTHSSSRQLKKCNSLVVWCLQAHFFLLSPPLFSFFQKENINIVN